MKKYLLPALGILSVHCAECAPADSSASAYEKLPFEKVPAYYKFAFINGNITIYCAPINSLYHENSDPGIPPDYDEASQAVYYVELDLREENPSSRIIEAIPSHDDRGGIVYLIFRKDDILLINYAEKLYLRFLRTLDEEAQAHVEKVNEKYQTKRIECFKRILSQLPEKISEVRQLRELCCEGLFIDKGGANYEEDLWVFHRINSNDSRNEIEYTPKGKKTEIYRGSQWNESACTIVQVDLSAGATQRFTEVDYIPKGNAKYTYIVFTPKNVMAINFKRNIFTYAYRDVKSKSQPDPMTSPHELTLRELADSMMDCVYPIEIKTR